MFIFPAIDILSGKAVRLFQGDYTKKETYGLPIMFAQQFFEQGATHLHLVDLDGAKSGKPKNFDAVAAICAKKNAFVQLGGGLRNEQSIVKYFEAGVDRVILGTAALKNPQFTQKMLAKYGQKIAIGVDARDGKVAIEGWLNTSDTDSYDFCKKLLDIGAKCVIYTDISRDGAESGPNFAAYRQLARLKELDIVASGGVGSIKDIAKLRENKTYGAIVGKAIYTGNILLRQAIEEAEK